MRFIVAMIMLAGLLLPPGISYADAPRFGVYVGAGTFKHDVNGDIAAQGEGVDLDQDLSLGDEQSNQFYVELDHDLRFVPKLRIDLIDVEMDGVSELGRDISFDGTTFEPPAALRSLFRYEQTNLALFFNVFDGHADIDVGLSLRRMEGELAISSTLESTSIVFDETLPLLYTRLRFDMYSGWWFETELQGMAASGNELVDVAAKLGWQSPWKVGVELGYREIRFQLEDVGEITNADFAIEGPYLGLNARF